MEKEKQPPDRDLSRKLDEVSAKRAAQKEVVFQKEMEAREIGKTPGGWQRFSAKRVTQKEVVFQKEMEAREIVPGRLAEVFGLEAGLLERPSSRRRQRSKKYV